MTKDELLGPRSVESERKKKKIRIGERTGVRGKNSVQLRETRGNR
jgi:hypothetical protein